MFWGMGDKNVDYFWLGQIFGACVNNDCKEADAMSTSAHLHVLLRALHALTLRKATCRMSESLIG
jgi:hypothetical protein